MINFLTQIVPAKFKKKVFLSNNYLLSVAPVNEGTIGIM